MNAKRKLRGVSAGRKGRRRFLFAAAWMVLLLSVSVLKAGAGATGLSGPQAETHWAREGRRFVEWLRDGKFDTAFARMTPRMQSYFRSHSLSSLWARLEKQMGKFQFIRRIRVVPLDSLYRVEVVSRFQKADLAVRIVFNRTGRVTGLWFAPAPPEKYEIPSYVDTAAFRERRISFGKPAFRLPGVLTLPKTSGQPPVIVLVHGSGPNDRDETVGPNRPFRDLAWGLASQGIAVFRYDKRTRVYAGKLSLRNITVEQEVIEDALLALNAVRRQPEVDSGAVFVLGHSLGAMLAPEIAFRDGRLRGVIMLAAPARSLPEIMLGQFRYLRKVQKDSSAAAQIDSLTALVRRLQAQKLPDTTMVLGAPARYYYDLNSRSPVSFAHKLQIPMLLLQGGRDYQVTRRDYELWRRELAGKPGVSFQFFPELNHLFIPGKGMATPEEYLMRKGHVAEKVVKAIARFVLQVSGSGK